MYDRNTGIDLEGKPRTADDEVINVVLHPQLIDGFREWLEQSGRLYLQRLPPELAGEDALPTYGVSFKEEPCSE